MGWVMQNIRPRFAICTLKRLLSQHDRRTKTFLNEPDYNVAQLMMGTSRTGIACRLCCGHSLCMQCDGRANLERRATSTASAMFLIQSLSGRRHLAMSLRVNGRRRCLARWVHHGLSKVARLADWQFELLRSSEE